MQQCEDWRLMESSRAASAHQLSGALGSRAGTENLCQGTLRDISAATTGQLYSSSIHQQPGGNSITTSYSPGKVHVVVGSRERHSDHGPTHPRCVQFDSRQRIQAGEGQIRLDVIPQCVSEDQSGDGSTGGGPVCIQVNPPTATVFQLDQAWYPVVLEMLMDYPRLITPQEFVAERTGSQGVGHNPSTSRLACLREKYRGDSLSTEASDLMLSSWRTKSSQSYDSLFRKWASWCSERNRNPVSGPIADVANFLAFLHKEGYKSRSLNAYRSAISSVHDTVDGVEVGKHPMISRLLKGAYHVRPPLPRYTTTWDVQVVLQYMDNLGPTSTLLLKPLTFKLVMLLSSQGRVLREFFPSQC